MKGLATEQLILLALGIIVLAVIGYLLYSLTNTNCQSDMVAACNKCKTCILGNNGNWVTCPNINGINIENTPNACTSFCKIPLGCDKPVKSRSGGTLNGCFTDTLVDVYACQAVGVS